MIFDDNLRLFNISYAEIWQMFHTLVTFWVVWKQGRPTSQMQVHKFRWWVIVVNVKKYAAFYSIFQSDMQHIIPFLNQIC